MFKLFSIPNTRKERGEDQDQRDQFQEGEGTEKRELRSTTKGRGGRGLKKAAAIARLESSASSLLCIADATGASVPTGFNDITSQRES